MQDLLMQNQRLSKLVEERAFVDGPEDVFTVQYGLWPERYLLLEGNVVVWASDLTYEARLNDMAHDITAAAKAVAWLPVIA